MDASTFQKITAPLVPANCPKTSSDTNSRTGSEQLHLLTTRVDHFRLTSEQALEQTKPLFQILPLANIKQFQYLFAVQHQVAQVFVDLNIEKLHATFRQIEDGLSQLRREVSEPSPLSFSVPLTVNPPCSSAFQDNSALNNAQTSNPSITITLKRALSTASKSWLLDQPRGPPPTLRTSKPSSVDLEIRIKQLEEEITKAKNCGETIISVYRSQFSFLYDRFRALESGGTDTILWILT